MNYVSIIRSVVSAVTGTPEYRRDMSQHVGGSASAWDLSHEVRHKSSDDDVVLPLVAEDCGDCQVWYPANHVYTK